MEPNCVQDIVALNIPKQFNTMRGRKLKSLSLSDKIRLLKEVEKGNRKKKDIAKEFGIPASTLSTICKSRDKLHEFAEGVFDSNRKRMKKAKHPDVEEETLKWISNVQKHNLPISGAIIRERAQWFAETLGYNDFQASAGWFENFRSRYKFILSTRRKKPTVTKGNDFHQWNNDILPHIVKEYEENNIFSANETCLFYKCFLDKNMASKCDYFSEAQIEERVTLMISVNMSGSEKLPLLLIGKLQNPICYSHLKSFPIQYESNEKASMTTNLFETWIRNLDEKFFCENRKIALIINDNTTHKKIQENLKSIKLIFVPQNLISHFQPMDQGIIKNFKYFYRKNMVLKFVSFLNEKQNSEISLLDCMRDIHMAWESVSASVISSSFRKAGFLNKNNNVDISDYLSTFDCDNIQEEWKKLQEMSYIPSDMTFESYVNIDENFMLLTHISDDNEFLCEDKGNGKEHEQLDSKLVYIPSFSEAFFASQNLRCFIESRQNVPNSVFQAFAHIDQFLLKEKCSQHMSALK